MLRFVLFSLLWARSSYAIDLSCLDSGQFVVDGHQKKPQGYILEVKHLKHSLYSFDKMFHGQNIDLPVSGFSALADAAGVFEIDIARKVIIIPYCKENTLFVQIDNHEIVLKKIL